MFIQIDISLDVHLACWRDVQAVGGPITVIFLGYELDGAGEYCFVAMLQVIHIRGFSLGLSFRTLQTSISSIDPRSIDSC